MPSQEGEARPLVSRPAPTPAHSPLWPSPAGLPPRSHLRRQSYRAVYKQVKLLRAQTGRGRGQTLNTLFTAHRRRQRGHH